MKIAAIALTSATLVALAQPGYAQNSRDQSDQMNESRYHSEMHNGPGMHRQFQNDDEQSGTTGRGREWSDRDDWRDRRSSDNRDRGHMHRWTMQGGMQGRMGPMMRMQERMANASEAPHFRFRRGHAAIDVQCPKAESLQACVNAAGQLLDKISSLRERNAQGSTNGMGTGSQDHGTSGSEQGRPFSNQSNRQIERPAVGPDRTGL